jgi:FkbM family methyltransferase
MKVVAVEPDYRTFEDLKSNVDNMFIYTYNLALGDGADFYLAKERKTPLCNRFVPKTETSESVCSKSFTLKQIVDISKVNVDSLWIKVDTEGAERYLFDIQSLEILKKAKVIVMEAHGNDDVGPIEDFLKLLDNSHLEDTHVINKVKTAPTLMNIKIVRKDYLSFLQSKGINPYEV